MGLVMALTRTGMTRKMVGLSSLLILVAFLLSACGGGDEPTPTQTSSPTATPTQSSSAGSTPTPGGSQATPTPTVLPVSFEGKTVRITVGYAPGGGFDTFARVMAVHLKEALPGKPQVIVTNLPGVDSLVAARKVLNEEPDENRIEIVTFITTLILNSVLGAETEGFDPNNIAYLGQPDALPSDIMLCARKSVVGDFEAFMNSPSNLTTAGTNGVSQYDVFTKWLELVGMPIDLVLGYGGSSEMVAAFNRGEVQATPSCRDADAIVNPQWVEDDSVTPLIYMSRVPDWVKEGQAQGKWPWVKSALDAAEGATESQKQAFQAFLDLSTGSRVYAMSPQTPAPIVAAVREAFTEVVNSQPFIDDITKRGYQASLLSGDQLEASIADIKNLSPEAVDILRQILQPR